MIGPEGKPLEVQIRTREMHQHSEYGVAAHWRYKEGGAAHGGRRDPAFEDRIAWLRQVLDWKDAAADASEWLAAFKSSLFTDTIYVLTPQGRVIDLPRGATPVDFAYARAHAISATAAAARRSTARWCRSTARCATASRSRSSPSSRAGPSRDWLNPELGLRAEPPRARQGPPVVQGAAARRDRRARPRDVERELQRAGATALNLDAVAAKAGFAKADELFAAAGRDEINTRAIQTAIAAVDGPRRRPKPRPTTPPRRSRGRSRAAGSGSGILIVGVDRLMTGLARCCKPAPPDAIVGFVTRGKGITIHRAACANVARARATQPERLITAEWGRAREEVFPVDIVVEASDRPGLLRDLSEVFSKERINVTAVNTLSRRDLARMSFTLEVKSVAELRRALAQVRRRRRRAVGDPALIRPSAARTSARRRCCTSAGWSAADRR